MGWLNDVASTFGIPAGVTTLAVFIYLGFIGLEKQAQNDGHIGPVTVTEVMRYATAPIVTLAASWRETHAKWKGHFARGDRMHDVPPVFITCSMTLSGVTPAICAATA